MTTGRAAAKVVGLGGLSARAVSPVGKRIAPGPRDADLVRRALEGDRWAEEALFRRHASAVAAIVMRMLGNRTEAEDVVQDTFVAGLTKLGTLRDPSAVRTWLVSIAVRRVQQRFRRHRLRRALGFERDREVDDEVTLARFVAERADPETCAELRLLDECLDRLPSNQRIAWMLRHVEGYALEEAASACGCSLATVKRRITRAEQVIRRHVRIEPEVTDG